MARQFLKFFNSVLVLLYRVSGGRIGGRMRGFEVLLLTTTGRKSGKTRTTPLGYQAANGGYVIIASNGGLPKHPAWYVNLAANPTVSIEVGSRKITATAEVLSGPQRDATWQHFIAAAPSYAEYQKQTTRQIPVVMLRPTA